ncbi:MAG: MFS transporter [Chloroflexi bacterium]|nr:MFS transporter [Chloroflexota bacterium]
MSRSVGTATPPLAAPLAPAPSSSPVRSLSSPHFRMLWFGSLFSMISFNMLILARGWLMLELTDSPLWVSLTAAAAGLPTALLSVVGGLLADRYDKSRILMIGEIISFTGYIILGLLTITKIVQPWQVMLLALFAGCSFALVNPSRVAILPTLVPRRDLTNAIAINTSMFSLSQILGPAMIGMIIGWWGTSVGLWLCAILSAPAIYLLGHIGKPPFATERPTGNALDNLKEGFAYIRGSRLVSGLILLGLFGTVFAMPYQVLMPVLARDHLGLGSQGLGLLQGAGGLGALSASIVMAFVGDTPWFRRLALASNLLLGVMVIAFALSPWFAVSLLLSACTGVMNQLYLTTNFTQVQLVVPDVLRGRVLSFRMIIFGLMPVGALAAGALAEFIGAPQAVALGGATCLVMVMIVLVRFPELRTMQRDGV